MPVQAYGSRLFSDLGKMTDNCASCGLPKLKQDMRPHPGSGRLWCLDCARKEALAQQPDPNQPLIRLR